MSLHSHIFVCLHQQFVVYGGYYYVLTLVFLGAGIYKLTNTGWLNSFKVCWEETVPKKDKDSADSEEDDATVDEEFITIGDDEESLIRPV